MKRIRTISVTLCIICGLVPATLAASGFDVFLTHYDPQDLLVHFTGDFPAYYAFLRDYYMEELENYDETHLYRDDFYSTEMCRAYNGLPHPYIASVLSEETGEVTVIGPKALSYYSGWGYAVEKNLVIPDTIAGHPVTKIADDAFACDKGIASAIKSVMISDNVREIGNSAFIGLYEMETVWFGKNVETIADQAFYFCLDMKIRSWGEHLRSIGSSAITITAKEQTIPAFPETIEYIGANNTLPCPDNFILPENLKRICSESLIAHSLIVLSKNMEIVSSERFPLVSGSDAYIYCYAGSTAEANAKQFGYTYYLIDGESLLFDGEPIEGDVLHLDHNMTEADLLPRLASDGAECEVRPGNLRDGKVVNGSTVTLWNTAVDAEGKVYTVEKTPEIESVAVETLPAKTAYFEGEAFDPAGLTLRVTYDDGTSEVVSNGFVCEGMPTVTVTYSGCTTQFDVTVTPVCVESVAIAALPKKTNYAYKEAFDPEGLTLTVIYNNGKTETVADGYALHSADNLIVGKNTVVVSFGGKAASFDITVYYTWWQHLIRIFLFGWLWY